MNKKGQSTVTGIVVGIFIVIALILFFVGLASFKTVDATHIGVVNDMGVLKGTMVSGWQFMSPFVHVEEYDLRTKRMDMTIDDANSAPDKEGQKVYASIQINFKTNGENVVNAYSKVGVDKDLPVVLNIQGIVIEAFKTVTAQYDSKNLYEKREELKEKAIAQIKANFPKDYLTLDNVVISNIGYSIEFQNALESKKVFEQQALSKAQEAEYQKQEALRQIEAAKGEAESNKVRQIATYEADAKKIELEAQASAKSILIKGEAEAQALALKKNELTPLMVQNNYIDMMRATWKGTYPQWVTGDSMGMIMNMGTGANIGNVSVN